MSATLITGIFLSGIGKIFLFLRGKTVLIPLILFFLKGRSQLTSSIGGGGVGGGECCGY